MNEFEQQREILKVRKLLYILSISIAIVTSIISYASFSHISFHV